MSLVDPSPAGATPQSGGRLPGLALSGGAFLFYLATLCPTVYVGDSGEIATAIATGGIVHPPGYPLFSLLGRAAMATVPFGEAAFRIGCVAALAGALAVYFVYRAARETGAEEGASLVAGAVYGVSLPLWSLSTRVEVYSFHAALVAAGCFTALRFRNHGQPRDFAALVAVFSLGLAHHPTIVLLVPAVAALILPAMRAFPRPALLAGLGLALLPWGPLSYLLLIHWARQEPLACWGNPVDLPLLIEHATARIYRGYLRIPNPGELQEGLRAAIGFYLSAFPLPGALLPLLGGWLALRRAAPGRWLLLYATLATGYIQLYAIPDPAAYYLGVWATAAILAAQGLEFIGERMRRALRPGLFVPVAGAVVVVVPLLGNWSACNLNGVTWVRTLAEQKLQCAGNNGVLITQGDNDSFPLLYVQEVLRRRKDVICLDRQAMRSFSGGSEGSAWYMLKLQRLGIQVTGEVWEAPDEAARMKALLTGPLARRLLWTTFATPPAEDRSNTLEFLAALKQDYEPIPDGLLFRQMPRAQLPPIGEILRKSRQQWDGIDLPHIPRTTAGIDMDEDYGRRHYISMMLNYGHLHALAGDSGTARQVFEAVHAWSPGDPEVEKALRETGGR